MASTTTCAVTSKLVVPQLKIRKKGRDLIREDGAKVVPRVNETDGKTAGMSVYHGSGRVDGHAAPDPVRARFGESIDLSMSEFQKMAYDKLRAEGNSHEMALLKVPTPPLKRVR